MKNWRCGVPSARCLGALGLMICVGLLAPASASALLEHPLLGTFGSVEQPTFTKAEGLVVDQETGDLLVIDAGAGTVSRYHPDGTPAEFSALGTNKLEGFSFSIAAAVQVSVDNSGGVTNGDIYVTQAGATPGSGFLDVFNEHGTFLTQLTESSEGLFTHPCGVAVDPSGNLYVGDLSGKIHKYEPLANPVVKTDNHANFPFSTQCTVAAGAGPTAGFVFPATLLGPLRKIDAATGEEKYIVSASGTTTETVDPVSGHLDVASGSEVREYDASGATEAKLLSAISPGGAVNGIAVDEGTGNIYVARGGNSHIEVWGPATILPEVATVEANPIGPHSATLHGMVNTAGTKAATALTDCHFEYVTGAAFEQSGFEDLSSGGDAACVPAAASIPNDAAAHAVSSEVENLTVGTRYVFRLVAANEKGSSRAQNKELLTLGPVIGEQSASQVTAAGARIGGLIDPNTEATTFQVEYVSQAKFAESEYAEASVVPALAREVGSGPESTGTEFIVVVQQLGELAPSTTYHFRLVVSNSSATVQGLDEKFTTFAPPGEALPDHRAYEMVSPAQKAGEVIPPEPASDLGGSCTECLPGGNTPTMPMQSAPDGEAVLYEGQPFAAGLAAGPNEYLSGRGSGGWGTHSLSSPTTTGRYEAFSADLSHGVIFQESPALSPEAPSREGRSYPDLYLRDASGNLKPLVGAEPPNRLPFQFQIRYADANAGNSHVPAFSHLVFEANDALTAEVPGIAPVPPEVGAGGECTFSACNLYEWAGGQLHLVNVLPGNTNAAANSEIGAGRLLAPAPQFEAPGADQAISADGSRIFWSSEETGEVYARIDGEKSFEVKAPGPGRCKKSVPIAERVCFLTASADGSRVLLSNGGIYALDEEAEAYEPSADLTEGKGDFKGILGASEDLSRVYFIDTEALTPPEEKNGNPVHPEHAEKGKFNLYAWHEGATAFIGAFGDNDNGFSVQGRYGAWKASRPDRTAQVSPDGINLAFMSLARMTGYNNARRGGGECTKGLGSACFEVFEYTAESGTLTCASCNPSGQRPIGPSNLSLLKPENAPFPQPGNLSTHGEGRLFFESQDAISPQDTNGSTQDVYEWEPNGVGTCETAGSCVSLISSGQGANDSMFLDSTPSGDDAFFITRQQLLARDKDQRLDLYDARVGGGFEEPKTTPCGGEACKGPIPSPPAGPGPASPGLQGEAPKPKPCKPGFVRKNGKCVKKHHHHHKRAASHGRGGGK